jgi:CRP-like cAMP-binding protein
MLAEVERQCRWREVSPDELVIDGQRGRHHGVFALSEGTVDVYTPGRNSNSVPLAQLTAPSCFGEYAVIRGRPGAASVRTVTRCTIGELPAARFLTLLQRQPYLSIQLLQQIVGVVDDLGSRLSQLKPTEARIDEFLRHAIVRSL